MSVVRARVLPALVALGAAFGAATLAGQHADAIGDGRSTPDWILLSPTQLQLRAERRGADRSRVYSVAISGTNTAAQTSTASVLVTVPHDARRATGGRRSVPNTFASSVPRSK